MIIQLENSAFMARDAAQWCSVCLTNSVHQLQSSLIQTKQKQRHHVKFQQVSKDSFGLFAPCHLQTKAPLAQEVEALSGEGHLHPMLNLLCERALHKLLLGEAEGRRISNLKTKVVFSQSVIISLILL